MIIAGKYIFYEFNVAFHIVRKSMWEPWELIGVYVTGNSFTGCKYRDGYSHIVKQFKLEVADAERSVISCSKEFLDMWRADHKDNHSLITPVINYCTANKNFHKVLRYLYIRYVCDVSSKTFAKITVMLKQRDRHFPMLMSPKENQKELRKALIEEGLI